MTNIKALLLDLDGTLINSERPFALAFIEKYNDKVYKIKEYDDIIKIIGE